MIESGKVKGKVESPSRVRLFATPWTVAYEAPLSMGFPRQEYWSGLPFPPPGDLPESGLKPRSPALLAYYLLSDVGLLHCRQILYHLSHQGKCKKRCVKYHERRKYKVFLREGVYFWQ